MTGIKKERLLGVPKRGDFDAMPLVELLELRYARLKKLASMVKKYFPRSESIGCFARVSDIVPKSEERLKHLRQMGYNNITIGVEEARRSRSKKHSSCFQSVKAENHREFHAYGLSKFKALRGNCER